MEYDFPCPHIPDGHETGGGQGTQGAGSREERMKEGHDAIMDKDRNRNSPARTP